MVTKGSSRDGWPAQGVVDEPPPPERIVVSPVVDPAEELAASGRQGPSPKGPGGKKVTLAAQRQKREWSPDTQW